MDSSISVLELNDSKVERLLSEPNSRLKALTFYGTTITTELWNSVCNLMSLEYLRLDHISIDKAFKDILDMRLLTSLKRLHMTLSSHKIEIVLPRNLEELKLYFPEQNVGFEPEFIIHAYECKALQSFKIACHPYLRKTIHFYHINGSGPKVLKLYATKQQIRFHVNTISWLSGVKQFGIPYPDFEAFNGYQKDEIIRMNLLTFPNTKVIRPLYPSREAYEGAMKRPI